MKRFILLTLLIPLFLISCEKEEDPVLTVSGESISAPANGSSTTFQLFSNNPWTVSAPGWCTVSPSGGDGASGEVQVKVTVKENDTYEARSADITFVSGELTKSVKVSQVANKGIVLPKDEYKVSSEGQQLEVTVKANVEYKVEIDVDWIRQAGTKALETTTFLFDIEPNEGYDSRQAVINIIDEEINDTLSIEIEQVQQDAIFVSPTEYNLSCKEHTLELEVQTNVDLEVAIPESAKDWVSHIETKALEDKTIVLKVAANTEYDPRTCEIQIKKKGEDYSETIFIYQEELQGVVLSEKVFNVSSEKQNVEVKFQTNAYVEYEVAEDSKEWISVLQTKSMEDKVLVLAIDENTSFDERIGNVFIKIDGSDYSDTVKIIQYHKDTLYFAENNFNVVKEGGSIDVKVYSTVEYDIEILVDWITSAATKSVAEKTHTFDVAANSDVQGRNGYILFKSKTTDHKDTVVVNQNGSGGYIWYNGIAASKSVPGSGTEGDPYIIHTANDLQWLIDQADYAGEATYKENGYDMFKTNLTIGKYYKLTHDLTIDSDYDVVDASGNVIEAKGWTPIGSGYEKERSNKFDSFCGNFDGGGHTIYGKMVPVHNSLSKIGVQFFGFFGFLDSYYSSHEDINLFANVKNLNMDVVLECDVEATTIDYVGTAAINVGAIAGFVYPMDTEISNCNVRGTIKGGTSTGTTAVRTAVGGLVGYFQGKGFINCHNYSTVIGGYTTGPCEQSYVGGITGAAYSSSVAITNCTNNGPVTAGSSLYENLTGGIGGWIANANISDCHNYAQITGGDVTYDGAYDRYSSRPIQYIGGLVGYCMDGSTSNCSNTGTIISGNLAVVDEAYQATNSELNIGGIAGTCYTSLENCVNKGKIIVKSVENVMVGGLAGQAGRTGISKSENYGSIEFAGEVRDCKLGGLFGNCEGYFDLVDCTNYADVTGPKDIKYSYTGGLIGYSGTRNIIRSINKGNVTGAGANLGNGYSYIGGLLGYHSYSNSLVQDCINEGNVSAVDSKFGINMGGIAGYIYNDTKILGSTNKGTVKGAKALRCNIGGLVGHLPHVGIIEGSINEGAVIGGASIYEYVSDPVRYDQTANTGGIVGLLSSESIIRGATVNKGSITAGYSIYGHTTYTGGIAGYVLNNTATICSCTKNEGAPGLPIYGGGVAPKNEDSSCTAH